MHELEYLIDIRETERQSGQGKTSIYKGMREGTFPQSVTIGPKSVRWRQSEVQQWVRDRCAERDAAAKPSLVLILKDDPEDIVEPLPEGEV